MAQVYKEAGRSFYLQECYMKEAFSVCTLQLPTYWHYWREQWQQGMFCRGNQIGCAYKDYYLTKSFIHLSTTFLVIVCSSGWREATQHQCKCNIVSTLLYCGINSYSLKPLALMALLVGKASPSAHQKDEQLLPPSLLELFPFQLDIARTL